MKKFWLGTVFTAAVLAVVGAGVLTNGVPQVLPGSAYNASNGQVNGAGQTGSTYQSEIGGYELQNADTQLGGGAQPQTVAPSIFQQITLALALQQTAASTCTPSGGACSVAATTNEFGWTTPFAPGLAAGATFTATVADTAITETSKVQAACYNTTNATSLQLVSVTPTAGTGFSIAFKNTGSGATGGNVLCAWQTY